jgi:dolichol-phosphate mannosyltransferase
MKNQNEQILISVVIPVYNEAENLLILHEALHQVLSALDTTFEIILVDDGSSDATFSIIKKLHLQHTQVKGLSFSKNFGHQIALFAGLQHSKGDIVITMDGDLQHPPSLIPKLLEKYREGYDIVNTRRKDEASVKYFKKWSSKLYYKLINYLSEVRIEPAAADFRLMNRKAVDAYLNIPERDRFTRGLISWMGFKQTIIDYQAEARAFGQSKFTLRKMLRFGLNGITSFSSRPLRLSFYIGSLISFSGFIYALYALYRFINGNTIEGWTSILMTLLIIGGAILINLGIIGEYIARIFNEVKARPLYFLKDQTGIQQESKENL